MEAFYPFAFRFLFLLYKLSSNVYNFKKITHCSSREATEFSVNMIQ